MEKKLLDFLLRKIKPSQQELDELNQQADSFVNSLEKAAKKKNVRAEIFIGGSLAKNTIIKKSKYDIDVFVRFEKTGEISDYLESILKSAGTKAERIHGSRDYFRTGKNVMFEIIPVMKIKNQSEAGNVTDLSYFHVSYILKELKKNKILADNIMLAKAFCYAQNCYGAESYIKGFSGYALELLISHYKSFESFVKAVARADKPIIIDPAKHFRNEQEMLLNLNEAKLQSPIIFVDPTFKERNALAALSRETFERFQVSCRAFLKKPGPKFFEKQAINKKKFKFILEVKTDKQEGDIAGSKLLKFFNFFSRNAEKYFMLKNKEFEYDRTARFYFNLEPKKELMLKGPPVASLKHLNCFKKAHRNVFIREGIAYAREKSNLSFSDFVKNMKKNPAVKEMGITEIKVKKQFHQ